jgi:signal transduction histidine kinase
MNLACQRLLGLPQGHYEGESIRTLVPERWRAHFTPREPDGDDSPYWDDSFEETDEGGGRTILLRSHLVSDDGSAPVILTVFIDLTAQVDAARRLAQLAERSKNYVQHLINVIPQPVYVRDADSRYLMVNEAFAAAYARAPEEICGLTPWELFSNPEYAAESVQEDRHVLTGKNVFKEVLRPYGVEREARCLVVSKGSCFDPEGRPVIVGSHFDVTKWRLAERQLQDALNREVNRHQSYQAYVQRLLDVIPYPVYVKNRESRCLLANEACAQLLGVERDAMIGQASVLAVDAESAAVMLQEDAEVLAGACVLKETSAYRFASDHATHYRVIAKGKCLDAEGEPVIVCAIFDVTEWRLAEARWAAAKEAADRANASKTVFLANMSHELRTPMHAVLSFARLGLTRTEGQADLSKEYGYFDRIVRSGERLLSLLNNLLDLAKLEDGTLTIAREIFDFRPVVEDSVQEFAALLEQKQISLALALEPVPLLMGDPSLIGQLIRNLLSNAVKFSSIGARIDLFVSETSMRPASGGIRPAIEFRIVDGGVGIPEEELETIFDKFVQSSKTHSGAGGTGLGLAICREIVKLHKGEIFARNGESGGAEFVVRLPLEYAGPPAPV